MKLSVIYLILFSVFFLIGCGKSNEDNKKFVNITPEQISNLLENQSFECASLGGGQCPEGIARIFILNSSQPDKSSLCTGFLTKSNQLVTNHHCISTDVQCASTYFSVYVSGSYEAAKCKRVIGSKDDGKPLSEKAVDYSVLELDRHIRNTDVFRYSSSSARPGSELTTWVIDHIDLFKARITELRCKLKGSRNSLELENCPSISGNSGSPVLNERGHIVGVLWGSTTNDSITEATPLGDRRAREDHSYATEVRHFKNLLR